MPTWSSSCGRFTKRRTSSNKRKRRPSMQPTAVARCGACFMEMLRDAHARFWFLVAEQFPDAAKGVSDTGAQVVQRHGRRHDLEAERRCQLDIGDALQNVVGERHDADCRRHHSDDAGKSWPLRTKHGMQVEQRERNG